MSKKLRRSRPMIRRAQTTDLRSLGVQSTADFIGLRQKPARANTDDEDVTSARTAVTAAVATRINRSLQQFNSVCHS